MSKFSFIKQSYTAKTDVWYDGILIGELDILIREKSDIDWQKYRADKMLKLSPDERWVTTWKVSAWAKMVTLGSFNSKEEAAQAILDEHRKIFERQTSDYSE
jgi:hypothetical protein